MTDSKTILFIVACWSLLFSTTFWMDHFRHRLFPDTWKAQVELICRSNAPFCTKVEFDYIGKVPDGEGKKLGVKVKVHTSAKHFAKIEQAIMALAPEGHEDRLLVLRAGK